MGWSDVVASVRTILDQAAGRRVDLVVRCAPYRCWRCGLVSQVPVVLHLGDAGRDEFSRFAISDPGTLPYVADLLCLVDHPAAATIKPRYSKAARTRYLSLGCEACDALFGMFPLEELCVSIYASDCVEQLPVMASLSRPVVEWWALDGVRSNV